MLFANENWNNPNKFVECLLAFAETAREIEDDVEYNDTAKEWATTTATICQRQGITTATMLMDRVKSNPNSEWLLGVSKATIESVEKFISTTPPPPATTTTTTTTQSESSTQITSLSDRIALLSNGMMSETIDKKGNTKIIVKDWRLQQEKVIDVLELFAIDTGIATIMINNNNTHKHHHHHSTETTTTPSAGVAGVTANQWATKQAERFRSLGLDNVQEIADAIRNKASLERIVQSSHPTTTTTTTTNTTTSSKHSSSTSSISSSITMTRLMLGTLNQFLKSLESDLLQPSKFISILMDYAMVHEVSRTKQYHYHHPHSTSTPTSTSSTIITDIPSWATNIVTEQFQFVMIETMIELYDSIQLGELDHQLENVGIVQHQRPNRYLQQRIVQFSMPSYQGYPYHLQYISNNNSNNSNNNHGHYRSLSQTIKSKRNNSSSSSTSPYSFSTSSIFHTYFDTMLTNACPEQSHLLLREGMNYQYESFYFTYEQRQQFFQRPLPTRLFFTNHKYHSINKGRGGGRGGGGGGGNSCNIDVENDHHHHSTKNDTDDESSNMNGFLRTRFSDQTPSYMIRNSNPILATTITNLDKYCHLLWQANDNGFAVNATLSNILTGLFEVSAAQYASEACILASALSEGGYSNIAFFDDSSHRRGNHHHSHHGHHKHTIKAGMNHPTSTSTTGGIVDVEELHRLFPKVLKIIFKNMEKYRFLSKNCNTYRLAHCLTDGSLNKLPLWIPTFSFVLQLSLLAYLILELIAPRTNYYGGTNNNDNDTVDEGVNDRPKVLDGWDLIALASFTSIYSLIQAMHGQAKFTSLKHVYTYHLGPYTFWMGILSLADVFANRTLPIALIVAGFMLITRQETLVDGVLLAAVLLFIPQLDKELPTLLNLDPQSIVPTYLVRKAVDELGALLNPDEYVNQRHRERMAIRHGGENIEFNDIFVTNPAADATTASIRDSPSSGCGGVDGTFGPHEVIHGHHVWGIAGAVWKPDKVYMAKNVITEDCLLKEVKWRYRRDHRLPRGYVEKLVLVRLDGGTVELNGTDVDMEGIILPSRVPQEPEHSPSKRMSKKERKRASKKQQKQVQPEEVWDGAVRGIYIVTQFEMKQSVTKLRICGSNHPITHKAHNLAVAKNNFRRAMEYYSLWDVDPNAVSILLSEDSIVTNGCGTTIGRWVRDTIMKLERSIAPE